MMDKAIFGVILAGGSGSRMLSDIPKQFLPLAGHPVLSYSIRAFLQVEELSGILLVCPEKWKQKTLACIQEEGLPEEKIRILSGGEDRSESLMQAVRRVGDKDAILITHDAVRPFVTPELIRQHILRMQSGTVACMTVIPATDTIAISHDGLNVEKVPNRKTMFQMQTPQTFHSEDFCRCYESMSPKERMMVTDACGVLLQGGILPEIIQGMPENIKITYAEDLDHAERIAARRGFS